MGGGWRDGARDGEAPHLAAGRGGADGGEERGRGDMGVATICTAAASAMALNSMLALG